MTVPHYPATNSCIYVSHTVTQRSCRTTLVHTNFWLRKFVTLHCSAAFLSSDYFCYATVSLENATHLDAAC